MLGVGWGGMMGLMLKQIQTRKQLIHKEVNQLDYKPPWDDLPLVSMSWVAESVAVNDAERSA